MPMRWGQGLLAGVLGAMLSSLLTVVLVLVSLGLAPQLAAAAEVLQVRSAGLLQVGDQNRSYSVELACLEFRADQQQAATDWLRRELPRRTRVNLRPLGADRGTLVAQVQRLDRHTDLAADLVEAGYATLLPDCGP